MVCRCIAWQHGVMASLLMIAGAVCAQSASYDVLFSNTFENAEMAPWTNISTQAGLYQFGDVVANMAESESTTNYAPNGIYCLWVGRWSSHYLELAEPLALETDGYTNLTISFNYFCRNPSSTRRMHTQFFDGTTAHSLGYVTYSGAKSYTVNSGSYTFNDSAKFQFTFADTGGGAGPFFIDDVVITASPPTPKGMVLIVK